VIDNNRFMSLEGWEAAQMQDPEFVAALAVLEPAYRIACLRSLTQPHLAGEQKANKQ